MNDHEPQQNADLVITAKPSSLAYAATERVAIAATPIQAKYIFLDVVGFTRMNNNSLRKIEDQTAIVQSMNCIVISAVNGYRFYEEKDVIHEEKGMIFLPTGDGICIALLNIHKYAEYNDDIQMDIALRIIRSIHEHNKTIHDGVKFKVRIGLNEYTDNMVIDINGKPNIVGDGINIASRIMSLADCNQILVGEPVFNSLNEGSKYNTSKFRSYYGQIKHSYILKFYQYVDENETGLDVKTPKSALPLLRYKNGSYAPEYTCP